MENEYIVIVDLGKESIFLQAENEREALAKARDIIADCYNEDLAETGIYSIYQGE